MTTPSMEASVEAGAKTSMGVLPICAFPPEITEIIARNLSLEDLRSLRSVCKTLNVKTFNHFSCTYFKIISTDLSAESLQSLKTISEHEGLKDRVKILRFCELPGRDPGYGFDWQRLPNSFLICNQTVKILQDILVKDLVNCRRFTTARDAEDPLSSTDFFVILFEIMKETGLPVRGLKVFLRNNILDIYRRAHQIQWEPRLITAWANLEFLGIRYTPLRSDGIVELITYATGLQRLNLNLWFCEGSVADAVLQKLSSSQTLPKLRELHLQCLDLTDEGVEYLFVLLRRLHHSLHKLGFRYLKLESNLWASGFKRLKNDVPLLERLEFIRLDVSSSSYTPYAVIFDTLRDDKIFRQYFDENSILDLEGHWRGLRYEGPNMSEVLDVIAGGVTLHEYPDTDTDYESDNENIDEDSDEDEDNAEGNDEGGHGDSDEDNEGSNIGQPNPSLPAR